MDLVPHAVDLPKGYENEEKNSKLFFNESLSFLQNSFCFRTTSREAMAKSRNVGNAPGCTILESSEVCKWDRTKPHWNWFVES